MKKVKMQINEFLQFRATCEKFRILFTYGILKGTVTIEAAANELETIGY